MPLSCDFPQTATNHTYFRCDNDEHDDNHDDYHDNDHDDDV